MNIVKFFLEATDGAFSGPIPDRAWSVASEHRTASAAVRAMLKCRSNMERVCGPNAWSQHFRVTRSDGGEVLVLEIVRAIDEGPTSHPATARAALLKTGAFPVGFDVVAMALERRRYHEQFLREMDALRK